MMDEKKKQEALKLLAKSKQREAISEKLYKVCLVSNMCTCLCISLQVKGNLYIVLCTHKLCRNVCICVNSKIFFCDGHNFYLCFP